MKFGVVVYPGSNCDDDMIHVLGEVLNREVQKIWHKSDDLQGLGTGDCIIIPGGFSYGDYLRAGAIARFSPVMKAVIDFAKAEKGFVFGICNGFQVLCEAHLLPGALLRNSNQRFICKNIHLKPETNNAAITATLDTGRALRIPIAHAEGRYFAPEQTLDLLEQHDQVLFRYCNAQGQVTDQANPNGSLRNIAGVTNEARNVFGMMPHPERASEEVLGNTDGRKLFDSLLRSARLALSQ